MKTFLAIDFGTTETSVAKTTDQSQFEPEIVDIDGKKAIDTALCLDKDKNVLFFGSEALDKVDKYPDSVFYNFKPYVGTDKVFQDTDTSYTADELSVIYLDFLRKKIEKKIFNGSTLADDKELYCVIGCPASWTEVQKNRITKIASKAGFPNVSCCDEPLGAVYYFYHKGDLILSENQKILVYDFGGGTTDTAIEELNSSEGDSGFDIPKLLAVGGDCSLGGKDFDEVLMNYYFSEMGVEISSADKRDLQEVSRKSREIKEKLSVAVENGRDSAEVTIGTLHCKKGSYDLHLSKESFEKICGELIDKSEEPVHEVMIKSGLTDESIDFVILAGGSSQLYYVRENFFDIFGKKKVKSSANPVEVIAKGLALYARASVCGIAVSNINSFGNAKGTQERDSKKGISSDKGNQDRKSPQKKTFWFYIFILVAAFLFIMFFLKGQIGNIMSDTSKPTASEQPQQRELPAEAIRKICEKYGFLDGQTFKEDREDYGVPDTTQILKYKLFDGERNLMRLGLTWKENGQPSGIFFCSDKIYFVARDGNKGAHSYDSLRKSNSSWSVGNSIGKTDDDKKKIKDVLNEIRRY
jgi:actin-like ATPase involved in cell morphogenesis